jgi:hypothetical protein
MVGIKTIPLNATTATVDEHFRFTYVRVRRSPHTKALVAEVEAFRAHIENALTEERTLLDAEAEAAAAVHFADRDLDDSVTFVAANTDTKSLLGARLFGDLRPSELRRPLLGGQLLVMTEWPSVLANTDKDVLKGHVPVLSQRVETAIAASEEKKKASQKLADFRTVGTRAKLNEAFNAFRKSLYGKLGDIQHVNGNLGAGWAESFFLQDTSEDLTIADLDRKIAAAEANLVAWKKQRDGLLALEEQLAAAKATAARQERRVKLDALQKAKAELEAKEAALLAALAEDEGQ